MQLVYACMGYFFAKHSENFLLYRHYAQGLQLSIFVAWVCSSHMIVILWQLTAIGLSSLDDLKTLSRCNCSLVKSIKISNRKARHESFKPAFSIQHSAFGAQRSDRQTMESQLEAQVQQNSYQEIKWGKKSFKRLCTHTISHEQQIQLHNNIYTCTHTYIYKYIYIGLYTNTLLQICI